jgi:hypothetical protein
MVTFKEVFKSWTMFTHDTNPNMQQMEPGWVHSNGNDNMENVNMLMERFKTWSMKLGNINPYCLKLNDYTLLGQKHIRVSQFWQIRIPFQSPF